MVRNMEEVCPSCGVRQAMCARPAGNWGQNIGKKAIWETCVVSPLPVSGRGLKDINGPNENDWFIQEMFSTSFFPFFFKQRIKR